MERRNAKGRRFFRRTITIILICLVVFAGVFMLGNTSGKKTYQNLRYKLTYQNLRYEKESDGNTIYETAVNEWIRNIKNVVDIHEGNISEYIDGWDTLTDEQQQAVIDMITSSNKWVKIAKVLDKLDDDVPVVFPKKSYLNGVFHIHEDCSVVLHRNAESQAILESYLCPKCEGSGQMISPRINCSACNGEGVIHIKCAKYDSESGWEDVTIPCDKCPLVSCNLCEGNKYCSIISIKEWKAK